MLEYMHVDLGATLTSLSASNFIKNLRRGDFNVPWSFATIRCFDREHEPGQPPGFFRRRRNFNRILAFFSF